MRSSTRRRHAAVDASRRAAGSRASSTQLTEAVRLHRTMTRKQAWDQAVEMLRLVRIPVPERRAQEYPHQLSAACASAR